MCSVVFVKIKIKAENQQKKMWYCGESQPWSYRGRKGLGAADPKCVVDGPVRCIVGLIQSLPTRI